MDEILCSIIIAARNEEKFICRCIESLENQEIDRSNYELLIVEGMSVDNTADEISRMQQKYGNIVLLQNSEMIASSAFNIGITHAKGRYIFIAGAHAEYPPDFIGKSLESIKENNADCVGGREIEVSEKRLGKAFAAVRNTAFGGGLSAYRYSNKKQFVETVAFGCYTKEILTAVGGFDGSLVRNQDNDLNKRIVEAGGKILFDPAISFYYYARDTLKGMIRQMAGYGYWESRLIKKRKSQLSISTFIPAVFVLYSLFAVLLFLLKGTALPLLLEFVPYLGIYAFFAVKDLIPKRVNLLTALFLYLLIHFSVGTGLIAGLIGKGRSEVLCG